jgi:hypothetical protein
MMSIRGRREKAIVQVWLAGMQDGMKLEQRGGFYEAGGVRVMMNSGHKG